jgi:hypothetical protein
MIGDGREHYKQTFSTFHFLSQPSRVSTRRHKQTHVTLPFFVDTAFGFLLRTALLAGVIVVVAALHEPPGTSCFHTAKLKVSIASFVPDEILTGIF